MYLWWNFVLKWQTFIFCYWETKSILITAAFYFLFFVKCWRTKNILYFTMQFAIRCCILGFLNSDSRRPAFPPWWGSFLVSFFFKFWSAYSFVSADGEVLLSYDKLFFYYWETKNILGSWKRVRFIVIFIVINFSSETFFRPVNYVHYAIRICFFSECYHLKVICKDNSNINFFSNSSSLLRLQRESCSCNIEFSVSKKLQKTFLVLTCTLKTWSSNLVKDHWWYN